jgi:hypothetical protein
VARAVPRKAAKVRAVERAAAGAAEKAAPREEEGCPRSLIHGRRLPR